MNKLENNINQIIESPTKAKMTAFILASDFKLFIEYFHYHIKKQEFIFKSFHLEIIEALEDIANGKAEKKNLIINLTPRFGKSIIMQYFTAWSFARSKNCNFIYTSFSDNLVLSFSDKIREVLQSELFNKLYNIEFSKSEDSKRKWTIEDGGGIYAASQGGAITGFGCFEYSTLVMTDQGYMQLGDIVENEKNVKIWSYNFDTNQRELQVIDRFIKNDTSEYIELRLDNGEIIKCTTDHIFYTKKGEELASNLTVGSMLISNSFNNMNAYPKFLHNVKSSIIFVHNKLNLLCRKISLVVRRQSSSLKSYALSFSTPINTAFNIRYISMIKAKILCYLFIGSFILSNLNGLFFGYLGIPIMSSMFYTILLIIALSSICNIRVAIIKPISIKMSNMKPLLLRTKKSMSNKLMNSKFIPTTLFIEINTFITFIVNIIFKRFISFCRKYVSFFTDKIFFKIGYRTVIDIININHMPSYCLTIRSNNNLFITKSQVLVHNCGNVGDEYAGALILDDPLKPQDAKSEIVRKKSIEYFEETLANRLNNPKKTPIIIIMQRLHEEDICGHIINTQGDDWQIITIPAYDEDKEESIWPEKYDKEFFQKLKERNPSYFYAQFQQKPVSIENAIYDISKINYVSELPQFDKILQSWDTAFKIGKENDYSACTTWGIKKTQFGENYYLIDVFRERLEYPQLKAQFIALQNKYNPYMILIEDKASGQSLLQDLKKAGNNRLKAIKADTDKVTRSTAPSDMIYNGQVFILEGKSWLADFKSELITFPNGKHDDQVDSMNQALNFLNKPRGFIGVF